MITTSKNNLETGTTATYKGYDFLMKFIILGDSSVGKTSLLLRFSNNIFNEERLPTIGIDYKIKKLQINNKIVKVEVWDTAGTE